MKKTQILLKPLFMFVILIGSDPAVARTIGADATQEIHPSVCKIMVYRGDHLYLTCSGTLTAKDEVTTGAHCFSKLTARDRPPEIKCGFQGIDPSRVKPEFSYLGDRKVHDGLMFLETHRAAEIRSDSNYRLPRSSSEAQASVQSDRAVVKLATESKLKPIPIRTLDSRQGSGISCKVSGYGIGPDGVGGIPHSATLARNPVKDGGTLFSNEVIPQLSAAELKQIVEFNRMRRQEIPGMIQALRSQGDPNPVAVAEDRAEVRMLSRVMRFLARQGKLSAYSLPGDSGGPLLCSRGKTGSVFLAGIASGENVQGTPGVTRLEAQMLWSVPDPSSLTRVLVFGQPGRPSEMPTIMRPSSAGEGQKSPPEETTVFR